MATMGLQFFCTLSIILLGLCEYTGVYGYEYCYVWDDDWPYFDYEYCQHGCCGSAYNQYCCSDNVGLIVGSVIAAIVLVCVIVGLIICCVKANKPRRAPIIQPMHPMQHQPNVTVVHTGGYGYQPPVPPPYAANPPPFYSSPMYPPPAANPAYPPPGYGQPAAAPFQAPGPSIPPGPPGSAPPMATSKF